MQIVEFNSSEFAIRSLKIDDEPWFVAKDACDALGYSDTEVALRKLDDDEKLIRKIYGSGQNRNMTVINESGLYSLILRSNKPQAKRFKKWVTSEVLPSIRKSGSYHANQNPTTHTQIPVDIKDLTNIITTLSKSFELLLQDKQRKKTTQSKKEMLSREIEYLDLANSYEQIILNNPGINQTRLLKAVGRKKADKTARKVLDRYTGVRWSYVYKGREKLYFLKTGA